MAADDKTNAAMLIEASQNIHRMTQAIICPPGTLALLVATWVIGIPALIWLFVVL